MTLKAATWIFLAGLIKWLFRWSSGSLPIFCGELASKEEFMAKGLVLTKDALKTFIIDSAKGCIHPAEGYR